MFSQDFISKNWYCSTENPKDAKWIMVGLPFDGTCSFKPGTRFAPIEIRNAAIGLESYSPYQNKDLEDASFYDAGELDLPFGNTEKALEMIYQTAKETLEYGKKWFGIGGEHLVTLPAIKAYAEKYKDLTIIQFDAHADQRDDYLGEKLSHASVIRRSSELVERVYQIGIRSGTKEEFKLMNEKKTLLKSKEALQEVLTSLGTKPVFLTIDLDVLDPSIMAGTGTQEPGGMTFNEFISYLLEFQNCNLVGADVVELSPNYDPSGVSTIVACKIIREILLLQEK